MKNIFITAVAFLFLSIASCSSTSTPDAETLDTDTAAGMDTAVNTAALRYDCPMHPEIISDKPGKCPVCKMTLVEIDDDASATDSAGHSDGQH